MSRTTCSKRPFLNAAKASRCGSAAVVSFDCAVAGVAWPVGLSTRTIVKMTGRRIKGVVVSDQARRIVTSEVEGFNGRED